METGQRNKRSIILLLQIAIALCVFPIQSDAQGPQSAQHDASLSDYSNISIAVPNIRLQLTKIKDGIARLDWTHQPGNLSNHYELIRTANAISVNIYSGTDSTYTDTITYPFCQSTLISYRVEITGLSGSASNTESDLFYDFNRPSEVIMDSISIDQSSGNPIISWTPSSSSDVAGYKIMKELPTGSFDSVGYALGSITSFFIAKNLYACNSIITFAILTIDLCGNTSGVYNFDNPLNTLLLNPVIPNVCEGTALLSWNPYKNMSPALGAYQVFRRENLGDSTLIKTTDQNTTTYTDKFDFKKGVRYFYFVRAISSDGNKTSTSCKVSFISDKPASPDLVLLNYVTVRNSEYVEMGIHFSPPKTVKLLRILRSESESGPFIEIKTFHPEMEDVQFDDTTADVNQRSYYYKIDAEDSCDMPLTSDFAKTIYLTCQVNSNESNTLEWNAYEGWTEGINSYEVFRFVNGIPDIANPIMTLPSGTTTYTDFPPASVQAGDILSYYVQAVEANAAPPDTSISNIVQALRQPLVMMPNAFVPGSATNGRFRPKTAFVAEGNYLLLIYNKWGQQVYESTDRTEGWDGRFNGELAPGGIYFYRVQYNSLLGESFSKNGSLILVR